MLRNVEIDADFCVVGGGLAGACAAIAAARAGAKTVLMQERPVLGGNASGEIRMWICGARDFRETGILEELQLENLYRNPMKNYSIWDSVLYGKVLAEPNITLLLNCSCCDAAMDGDTIRSVRGWQMTTQTWITVRARLFADCSGDSILAPLTGAEYRVGRESADEFGEKISVTQTDRKTMGMSCLIQARKGEKPSLFTPPSWAKKLTKEEMDRRRPDMDATTENFWYLELGGDRDSIHDTEAVRDELLALAFGYWDYVKNSGEFDAALWQLDFVGFLPGKRESRRMVGPTIMTQNDILSGGLFDDVAAFGGWPLDDHHPAGFYHEGNPNQWGDTPSPYGIPYRVLYSENIKNLFFAGRNISMTHAAMSSARVMATCALLGQAVGEAAALAAETGETPHGIYERYIRELQERLQKNDAYLPGIPAKVSPLTMEALLEAEKAEYPENLRNGIERNHPVCGEGENGCLCGLGSAITARFNGPRHVREVRIVWDSDLDRATLPGDDCERKHNVRANITPDSPVMHMPTTLVRQFALEADTGNGFETVLQETENIRRLTRIPLNREVMAVRLVPQRLWEDPPEDVARIFTFELA